MRRPSRRRRFGHSYLYAVRSALRDARAQGAEYATTSDRMRRVTVYRSTSRGWQSARLEPGSDGGFYMTPWAWGPESVRHGELTKIDDAIQRAQ